MTIWNGKKEKSRIEARARARFMSKTHDLMPFARKDLTHCLRGREIGTSEPENVPDLQFGVSCRKIALSAELGKGRREQRRQGYNELFMVVCRRHLERPQVDARNHRPC